jgi:hypothetical protein
MQELKSAALGRVLIHTQGNIRYQGQSGRVLLGSNLSAYDPKPTLAAE